MSAAKSNTILGYEAENIRDILNSLDTLRHDEYIQISGSLAVEKFGTKVRVRWNEDESGHEVVL